MITITVKKRKGTYLELISKGHAGYARGRTGYCLCRCICADHQYSEFSGGYLQTISLKPEEDDGYVSIRFTAPVTEKGKLLMDSLILGLNRN